MTHGPVCHPLSLPILYITNISNHHLSLISLSASFHLPTPFISASPICLIRPLPFLFSLPLPSTPCLSLPPSYLLLPQSNVLIANEIKVSLRKFGLLDTTWAIEEEEMDSALALSPGTIEIHKEKGHMKVRDRYKHSK